MPIPTITAQESKLAAAADRREGCSKALHRDYSAPGRRGQPLVPAAPSDNLTLTMLGAHPSHPVPVGCSPRGAALYQSLGDRGGAVTEAQHHAGGAKV